MAGLMSAIGAASDRNGEWARDGTLQGSVSDHCPFDCELSSHVECTSVLKTRIMAVTHLLYKPADNLQSP